MVRRMYDIWKTVNFSLAEGWTRLTQDNLQSGQWNADLLLSNGSLIDQFSDVKVYQNLTDFVNYVIIVIFIFFPNNNLGGKIMIFFLGRSNFMIRVFERSIYDTVFCVCSSSWMLMYRRNMLQQIADASCVKFANNIDFKILTSELSTFNMYNV